MGFFDTIKNFFGIGGVSLDLAVPAKVDKATGVVHGRVLVSTKSDKRVKSFTVKLVETWQTGRGDDKQTKEFDLGEIGLSDAFDIKPGEQREVEFELPFQLLKSSNEQLAEKGGMLGAIGKMGSWASAETSTWQVKVTGQIEGVTLGPTASKPIVLA